MRPVDANKWLDNLNRWFVQQNKPIDLLYQQEVTTDGLCGILKCSAQALHSWASEKAVVPSRKVGKGYAFKLRDVYRQLECVSLGQPNVYLEELEQMQYAAKLPDPVVEAPPAPVVQVVPPTPVESSIPVSKYVGPADEFEATKERAYGLAKSMFKAVLLQEANKVKERGGDPHLVVKLLETFIHADENLRISYEQSPTMRNTQ
jgi:hypothetical protein